MSETLAVPSAAAQAAAVIRVVRQAGEMADRLAKLDHDLCMAIAQARTLQQIGLHDGLLRLQAEFEGLVAGLQPALLLQPQEPVAAGGVVGGMAAHHGYQGGAI